MGNQEMCKKCQPDTEYKIGSKANRRQIVSLAFGNMNKKPESGIKEKIKELS